MIPIVNTNYTLQITGVAFGVAIIISLPSVKVKANNLFVYSGIVMVLVSGCTNGTYNQVGTSTGSFIITSNKVKVDNSFVLRENDITAPIPVILQNSVSPFDSVTISVIVSVSNAGQVKVLAN